MKKFLIMFFTVFLIFSCKDKSDSSEANVENEKPSADAVTSDNKLIQFTQALQGDYAEQRIDMVDVSFKDLDGNDVKLSDYKGKVIFLNLWATWCPPCRKEMPSMQKLNDKYKKKDFVMLAVSVGEAMDIVKPFVEENKYTFDCFIDPANQVSGNYSTGSIPTTYFIAKDGRITSRFVGGREWDSQAAYNLIEYLLEE